jgi:hypothetical protein
VRGHAISVAFGSVLAAILVVRVEAQCPNGRPVDLTDPDGFLWDPIDNGGPSNGTDDAFDGGMVLYVNDTRFPGMAMPTRELGGRQQLRTGTIAGVDVERRIYVPSSGPAFARFLETFIHRGMTPVTVRVRIETNVGSDFATPCPTPRAAIPG